MLSASRFVISTLSARRVFCYFQIIFQLNILFRIELSQTKVAGQPRKTPVACNMHTSYLYYYIIASRNLHYYIIT